MTLTTTEALTLDARAQGRGVGAFNVITLEQAEGVLAAAESRNAPVIVQVSENAVRFHGGRCAPLMRAILTLIEESSAPAALHLDHSTSLDLCRQAVDAGASSVMFDAAHLDFADNVRATAGAADWARSRGVWIEAELGAIGGKGGAHTPGVRTDPAEASQFVGSTCVDALAVAVGSTHAQHERSTMLDQSLISRLAQAVPVPLVLHGSSGVPDSQLAEAVRNGIVKVNVGTAVNIAYTTQVRRRVAEFAAESDPRPGLVLARTAIRDAVAALIGVVRFE